MTLKKLECQKCGAEFFSVGHAYRYCTDCDPLFNRLNLRNYPEQCRRAVLDFFLAKIKVCAGDLNAGLAEDMSRGTIRNTLKKLVQEGKLERVGYVSRKGFLYRRLYKEKGNA